MVEAAARRVGRSLGNRPATAQTQDAEALAKPPTINRRAPLVKPLTAKEKAKPAKVRAAKFPEPPAPAAPAPEPRVAPQASSAAQVLDEMARAEERRVAEEEAAAAAAKAAAEDGDVEPEILTRRARTQNSDDWSYIPEKFKKPGWDYEWKTTVVEGKPTDSSEMAFVHEQGWRPVRPKDMPGYCPPGYDKSVIERMGQIMVMRPMSLTLEARAEDYEIAEKQKSDKMQASSALPLGKPGYINPFIEKLEMHGEVGRAPETPNRRTAAA